MKTRQLKIRAVALLIGALALLAGTAVRADLIYTIGAGSNIAQPGPYGEVRVSLIDSTRATITLTALSNATNTFGFIDGNTLALQVNAPTFTATGFTWAELPTFFGTAGGPAVGITVGGGQNINGTVGTFNLELSNTDGSANALASLSFTLTNTGGTWASTSAVLGSNGNGYSVAGHVNSFNNATGASIATGYAGSNTPPIDTNPNPVPIPAAFFFVAPALMGLGFVGRKKKGDLNGLGAMAAA